MPKGRYKSGKIVPADRLEFLRKISKLGGRPKLEKTVIAQEKKAEKLQIIAEKKAFDQEVLKIIQPLFISQASVALGQSFLFKVVINSKGEKEKPELITDISVIKNFLQGVLKNDEEKSFYYITTKEPVYQAADSLLNRVLGKPVESVDMNLTGEVKLSLRELSLRALARTREAETVSNSSGIIDAEVKTISAPVTEQQETAGTLSVQDNLEEK